MAPFRFRLSTLLKLREGERRQRQLETAQAQEAERILLGQAGDIASEIERTRSRVRTATEPGDLPVDSLLELQRYTLQLKAQATILAQQISTVRAEVERRRQILLEADRQVRTLEKLRDRQSAIHRVQAERLEQKRFDDLAQQRFVQQRRGAGE